MKFFEEYFTKHHLFRTPHKWFLALLISPIHGAEMRYKKKYHLNFNHARKLFAFDMMLLLFTITLGLLSIFWFLYDPTITNLVHIDMAPITHVDDTGAPTRIASGEDITYRITYTNKSDVALIEPTLRLAMPAGFLVDSANPKERYNQETRVFHLPDLPPKSSEEITIGGIFFGEPDKEASIVATLSYTQPDRSAQEQKHAGIITTLRGSLLKTEIDFPETILTKGTFPVSITLQNTAPRPLQHITLPFSVDTDMTLQPTEKMPQTTNDGWLIPVLQPNEAVTIKGLLSVDITDRIDNKTITIAPHITVNGQSFRQQPDQHTFVVVRPEINVSASWADTTTVVRPGETRTLHVTLQNTSSATFEGISVSMPTVGSLVDASRLRQLNSGSLSGNTFVISSRNQPSLNTLAPGQSVSISINVPIRYAPEGGTDLTFLVPLDVSGSVQDVLDATYTTHAESATLSVGTHLGINTELRYYTNEGDQLGRGPLPPRVGEETKYWVMMLLSNGTSRITDLRMNVRLAPGIAPTGRSSVSLGNDVSFNNATRTMSWTHSLLGPHQQAGIYFEVSFTPTPGQQGTTPLIVEHIGASAYDTYIQATIDTSDGTLDISLPDDPIGNEKGTTVQ